MSIFHRHKWQEVGRTIVPGALETGRALKVERMGSAAQDALYGFTLIEVRCEECGQPRIEKFTGALARKAA